MDPSSSPALKRNWADLQEGPAGQIADLVLAYDVAGYLRFRAVCRSWRRCTAEPRAEGGLDRRFHPRRWILLREELATPDRRRRLLNTSTGECVQVDLPELRDHKLLSVTAEGLLVLLHKRQRASATVRLLNPLTRHLTELPPLATMLPKNLHVILSYTQGWGSGILDDDDSTVVLSFNELDLLAVAKPGDASWTPVSFHSGIHTSSSMFAGRYYCVTHLGVMVLKNQPPRLEVAAELPARVSKMAPGADSVHLVDNAGELMLVHRRSSYDVYRMDLDGGTPRRVNSFGGGGGGGGHALFIGAHCSLSVPIGVFPTGSISGDTIYSGFDDTKGDYIQAYHIGDKSTTYVASGKMALPHTLLNCLSLCITGRP